MSYEITTQRAIRKSFWTYVAEVNAEIRSCGAPGRLLGRKLSSGEYDTDTRTAFAEWVDVLQKNGTISEALAQRVTLTAESRAHAEA